MYKKGIYSYLFLGRNFIRKQLEWHTRIVYFPSYDYVLIYFLYLFMRWMQRRKMLSINTGIRKEIKIVLMLE